MCLCSLVVRICIDFCPQNFHCLDLRPPPQPRKVIKNQGSNISQCGRVEKLACVHCTGRCCVIITFSTFFTLTVWFLTLIYCDNYAKTLYKIKNSIKMPTSQSIFLSSKRHGTRNVVGNIDTSSGWALGRARPTIGTVVDIIFVRIVLCGNVTKQWSGELKNIWYTRSGLTWNAYTREWKSVIYLALWLLCIHVFT